MRYVAERCGRLRDVALSCIAAGRTKVGGSVSTLKGNEAPIKRLNPHQGKFTQFTIEGELQVTSVIAAQGRKSR